MFSQIYDDWNRKRAKAIIDHYGYRWFHGKRILDLGAGQGDIAASLSRLGADIICVDVRQENLDVINKKHPHIKTMRVDLDKEWPFYQDQFDMVLSLGLLCHLKNHDSHLERICSLAEHVILETEVLDSPDFNAKMTIYEEKLINDLSFSGEGSIVSAVNIQNKLSELEAKYKRIDDPKINSGQYNYDWKETDSGRKFGNRRIWFIRLDQFIMRKIENQLLVNEAERAIQIYQPQPASPQANTITNYYEYKQPVKHPQPAVINPKIRLFYNYYEDKNPARKKEIDYCFQKNIENPSFEIVVLESNEKPTYNFYFEKINKLAGPNDISIICNSDIFFDTTISFAKRMGAKDVYALSRWDWYGEGTTPTHRSIKNSQDTWIIKGPVENVNGDFCLGVPFCDNRIAFEFNKAGYKVLNPSKSIKSYHFHNSGIRTYNEKERVPGQILFIEPTAL